MTFLFLLLLSFYPSHFTCPLVLYVTIFWPYSKMEKNGHQPRLKRVRPVLLVNWLSHGAQDQGRDGGKGLLCLPGGKAYTADPISGIVEVTTWTLVRPQGQMNTMLVCTGMHLSRSRRMESLVSQVTCQAQAGPGAFQCQLQACGSFLRSLC